MNNPGSKILDILDTRVMGLGNKFGNPFLFLILCTVGFPLRRIVVRRDHILEDAYDQIMKESARSLQRNRLEIQFAGEEGWVSVSDLGWYM